MTERVSVTAEPIGRGRSRVVAQLGAHPVHADEFSLGSERGREQFLKRVKEAVPALTPEALAAMRAQLVQEAARPRQPAKPAGAEMVHGRTLEYDDPDPWPEPVDGAVLLDRIAAVFARYCRLPAHGADALALWVVHTYALNAAEHTPRLVLTSPEKRSGKTRVLRVLGLLVHRPLTAENVSAAALYRMVERDRPTLLLDEADAWLVGRNADDSLRGLLNAGFEPGGAVIRCVGEDSEPAAFRVYAPVALAMIGQPQGTIADRGIMLPMVRATPQESAGLDRLRVGAVRGELRELRCMAVRWAADRHAALVEADPSLPEGLDDRARDCWRPLVAIANEAGGEWPARARAAAEALSDSRDAGDESHRVRLLRDIRRIFEGDAGEGVAPWPEPAIKSETLAERLAGIEGAPWAEWGRDRRPLSKAQLARLLAPFGVRPKNQRLAGGQAKGYARSQFMEVWERYAPPTARGTVPPSQPSNGAAPSGTVRDPASVPSRPGVPGPLPPDGTLGRLGRAGTDPENGAVPRQPSNGAAWDGGTAQEEERGQDGEPCPAWFMPEDPERRELWAELDSESRQAEFDSHARQAAVPATCYPDGQDVGEQAAMQAEGLREPMLPSAPSPQP
ncbi:MAG: DUF3631 domain-containing protein [Planctomycetes bacterium]|nr:DUF3631 domain-containing protein [Planctomycetota bacterium]